MSQVIFTKFSNDRAAQFAIKTFMVKEDDGSISFCKSAAFPEGQAHIQNTYQSFLALEKQFAETPLSVNRCTLKDDVLVFDFVQQASTLEEKADGLLDKGDINGLKALITDYCALIRNAYPSKPFENSDAFTAVFGEADLPDGLTGCEVADIDMVLANVLLDQQGNMILTDYEWTFHFMIPLEFVLYRIIHYYLYTSSKRLVLEKEQLFEAVGIDAPLQASFAAMERAFQHYTEQGHISLNEIYGAIHSEPVLLGTLCETWQTKQMENRVRIYFDRGNGFTDKDSYDWQESLPNGKTITLTVPVPQGVRQIRVDTGESPVIMHIEAVTCNQVTAPFTVVHQKSAYEAKWFVTNDDPYLTIESNPHYPSVIQIRMKVYYQIDDMLQSFFEKQEQQRQTVNALQQTVTELEMQQAFWQTEYQTALEILHHTRQSFIWRMTQPLRSLLDKIRR